MQAEPQLNQPAMPAVKIASRYAPQFRSLSRLGFMIYVSRVPTLVAVGILLFGWQAEQIHEVVRVLVLDVDNAAADSTSVWNLGAIYGEVCLLSLARLV